MLLTTLINSVTLFAATGLAGYSLQDDYFSGNFFDEFSFWDSADPTNGFVSYQNQGSANASGLIKFNNDNSASMLVDSTNVTPQGRPSVRLTSNKSYGYSLVVIDLAHMPASTCGTWPAFWMVGPNWPNGGEIDIIEGVNTGSQNQATLHTGQSCSINSGDFSGSMVNAGCTSSGSSNQGCGIMSDNSNSYGTGFNQNGGGVYAMEWTSSYISVWFFPRGSVPSDASSSSPDPSGWGTPMAHFTGACDMGTAFSDQQIVFDTTFCGDWAGGVWGSGGCAASTGNTCQAYVENTPGAFAESYWQVNSLKVYSPNSNSPAPVSTYIASSTSIQYVTQPAAQTSVAQPATPTTFVVATSSSAPYVPVVGPGGSVGDSPPASPAETGTSSGYAPIVGGDGTVGAAAETDSPQAPQPGSWSTTSDGALTYWKREGGEIVEDVEKNARHARHLRFHKGRSGRF